MSSSDLLSAGTVCSHSACRTIDFLPFKCSHCTKSYCQEHWKPADHECKDYDPAAEDRIVPQCPLCSLPVMVQPGQDPNAAMDRHINANCQVATGKKKSGPHCGNKKCGKSLISPIICNTCRGQFCPAHRLPSTHTCRTTPGASASQAASSRFPAASPAGLAALKRAAVSASNAGRQASTQAKATTTSKQGEPSTSSATGSSTKGTSLFQEIKTDRRSTAEEKSRLKALQAKATKGLLSEQEMQALREAEERKKDDCVIQ